MIETIVEALDDLEDPIQVQNEDQGGEESYEIVEEIGENQEKLSYTIIEPMEDNINYAILGGDSFIKNEDQYMVEPVKVLNRIPEKPKILNVSQPKILNKAFQKPRSVHLMDSIIQQNADGNIEIITEVCNYEQPEKKHDPNDPLRNAETVPTHVFSCTMCERSFPLQQLLDIHMKNHTRERNHPCGYCEKKFFSKYDLGKHILTHTGERPYQVSFLRVAINNHEEIAIIYYQILL
jgi:hypothetical protein